MEHWTNTELIGGRHVASCQCGWTDGADTRAVAVQLSKSHKTNPDQDIVPTHNRLSKLGPHDCDLCRSMWEATNEALLNGVRSSDNLWEPISALHDAAVGREHKAPEPMIPDLSELEPNEPTTVGPIDDPWA